MKELELKYYFEHMEEFRHNELFENCTYIWEPLSKINDYIKKKIVYKNIQINKAEEIGLTCRMNYRDNAFDLRRKVYSSILSTMFDCSFNS